MRKPLHRIAASLRHVLAVASPPVRAAVAFLSTTLLASALAVTSVEAGGVAGAKSGSLASVESTEPSHLARPRAGREEVLTLTAPTGRDAELDRLLAEATELANAGSPERAHDLYLEVEAGAEDWSRQWAAISGQVWAARIAQSSDLALSVTRRVAEEFPLLAGLLAIWDGDTLWAAGDLESASQAYRAAATEHGDVVVDGVPVGVTGLRLLGQLKLELGDAAAAAAAQRMLLTRFGSHIDRESVLARALLLEAAAREEVSLERVRAFLALPSRDMPSEHVLRGGRLIEDSRDGAAVPLRGAHGISFVLGEGDRELLAAVPAQWASVVRQEATACTVLKASDGFQNPISYDSSNFGFRFMSKPDCCGGWHPGVDLNAPNDCSLDFRSVARGCVRDTASSGRDYGTVAVEHYYLPDPWVSTYLHGDVPPAVSVGQTVFKGTKLGNVGNVGTTSCHLHLEVREADHGYRNDAHNYTNTPQSTVGDWFQDPLPFIAAHRSYSWVLWVDESAFTRSGAWTFVSGIGNRDDSMWAATASTLTSRARFQFTTTGNGTHELWAFVPWQNSTSRRAPYKLVRSSTGATVISGTVDQNPHFDAWVRVGTASLSANTAYRIEVGNNTGESGRRVTVDDFLVIRRP